MLDDTRIHLSLRNKLHFLPSASIYVTTFFDNANRRDTAVSTVSMLLFTHHMNATVKISLQGRCVAEISILNSCKSILKGSNLSHFLCCTEDAAA